VPRDAEEARVAWVVLEQDVRHVEERLDVVHHRRLAVQPDLDRERRLVARLPSIALDRLEERGLLPAVVGSGVDPEVDLYPDVRARAKPSRARSLAPVRARGRAPARGTRAAIPDRRPRRCGAAA